MSMEHEGLDPAAFPADEVVDGLFAAPDPEPATDPVVEGATGAAAGVPDIPEPAPLTVHGPARIIAMVNQKGGVGKTTSTVSLGAALAGYGRKVLLVDFDPQGAVAVSLGINPNELDLTIYNLLTQADCHVGDVIILAPLGFVGLVRLPPTAEGVSRAPPPFATPRDPCRTRSRKPSAR